MGTTRPTLRHVAVALALVAAAPYLVFKVLWLSGSTVGMTSAAAAAEMSDWRVVVANAITAGLMLVGAGFAVALAHPAARRVPAWLVFVLGAGATGLLAPVLLGLPLGLGVQLMVQGNLTTDHDPGLAPWVYGFVYGGFALLAIALTVLLALYVRDRWGHLLTTAPTVPSPLVALMGALGFIPFGVALLYWGALGPGASGPQGMVFPVQRTVLAVTGALAVAAFAVPLLAEAGEGWPRRAWLVTWTGCCVAALQGPMMVLLAKDGVAQPAVVAIAVLATPASVVYGLSALRRAATA